MTSTPVELESERILARRKTRRSFIKGAAAASVAAAVAAPTVVRAQDAIVWKFQSTWPAKDIFHEYAQDFVNRVNEMSGGRLKLDLLAGRRRSPRPSRCRMRCIAGTLDGGHGVCAYWYGKNKAYLAVRHAAGLRLARQPDARLDASMAADRRSMTNWCSRSSVSTSSAS